jgi:3-methyladenine DNA glycosylase AlkC
MLSLLETPNWKNETPLAFYLTPLADQLKDVRDCLLKMHQEGPLHCKYVIENNEDLMKKTCEMVKKDVVAQWLAGDELKQDQFKFIYQTVRIMYMSALKPLVLADDKRIIETILPNLVAFRAIRQSKDILIRKKVDTKKDMEKVERMLKTGGTLMSITMGATATSLGGT